MRTGPTTADVESYALEAITIGIIVTDQLARAIYANATADRVLGRPFGALTRLHDRIAATDKATNVKLMGLLANACRPIGAQASGGHLLAASLHDTRPAVALRILPYGPMEECGRAMIFVREIDRNCNLEVEAMRLFGLTEMEAKFASALASGLSLADAASTHRVTVSTARAHLSRVFQKTGTRQQSQVAALLRGAQIPVEAPGAPEPAASYMPRPRKASAITSRAAGSSIVAGME